MTKMNGNEQGANRPLYNKLETKKPFYKKFWFYVIVILLASKLIGEYIPEDNKPVTTQTREKKKDDTILTASERNKHATTQAKDNSTMAYIMFKKKVRSNLVSPSSAKFAGGWGGAQKHVRYLGNQKYSINAYVDSQNGFGAMIRTYFSGTIEQLSDDAWRTTSLEIR